MARVHHIYKTTCNVNDKYYIGAHYGELDDAYLGSGTTLTSAISKYGSDQFTKEILCICTNDVAMWFMEKVFISENEVKDRNCYNMKIGGLGGFSEIAQKAGTEAAAIANRNRVYPPRHWVANRSGTKGGWKMSEQGKHNISSAQKGKTLSEETKRKLSEAAHRQWKRQKEGVPSHAY